MATRDRPSHDVSSALRRVNLRTDLARLADLIELCFASTMDDSGRRAIREMRHMSRIGIGLSVLNRLNELALGISLGYVWEVDSQIVGNVSIFPASWHKDLGSAWIIANVAVHPDYRRQGIARQLMAACLDLIQQKGGQHAILQVNYDNDGAIVLYEELGFIKERAFTIWQRSNIALTRREEARQDIIISPQRGTEWEQAFDFVSRVRPQERGGIGWLMPLHKNLFYQTALEKLINFFSLSQAERLIARKKSVDTEDILALLWLNGGVGTLRRQCYLFADPTHFEEVVPTLLQTALSQMQNSALTLEHPADDEKANKLLRSYRFTQVRTVWHMHLTF